MSFQPLMISEPITGFCCVTTVHLSNAPVFYCCVAAKENWKKEWTGWRLCGMVAAKYAVLQREPSTSAAFPSVYSGDANLKTSSKGISQAVKQYTTTTSLNSAPNPSIYGQTVTLTASVKSTPPGVTDSVTFKNGTAVLE